MKKVIKASFVENERGEKFFYTDFIQSRCNRKPLRIWLAASLLDEEGNITFPAPAVLMTTAEGALVSVKKNEVIKLKWTRTGRLRGGPAEGITIVMPDSEEQIFANLPDGLEALEEIEDLKA